MIGALCRALKYPSERHQRCQPPCVRKRKSGSLQPGALAGFGLAGLIALVPAAAKAPLASRVGLQAQGGTLVATGETLHPAGDAVTFGGRPVDLALSPDGSLVFLKDNRGLVVIEKADWKIRQELTVPGGGTSLHGLAVRADGKRIYLTSAANQIYVADITPQGTFAWNPQATIVLPGPSASDHNAYPCGLALAPDGTKAYVCLSRDNALGIVDLTAGRLTAKIPVGVAPWGVVLSPEGQCAYVTNWGGRQARTGDRTADSAGTPTLVDARGVASSGTISVVNLQAEKVTAEVTVGLHPCDMALTRNGRTLYVANANDDTVSVLGLEGDNAQLRETLTERPDASLPFGSMPDALALSRDEKTLYVALAGNNAVAVVATEGVSPAKTALVSRARGFLPTGWYSGALAVDDANLYVANVKGLGSRTAKQIEPQAGASPAPSPAAPKKSPVAKQAGKRAGWSVYDYTGSANRISLPDASRLRAYTAQVRAASFLSQRRQEQQAARATIAPAPVPSRVGEPSVFQHVVYILKENRTYDQVFGDLKQGDGDPDLCLYGRDVTPNHHALAEQFVLLDNFYCNGVLSADGHSWATEGNVTDHLEKAFGGFTRSYTFGDDPLTYSSSGFLWDNALAHGLTFRNYGEMDYTGITPDRDYAAILNTFQSHAPLRYTHSIGVENLRRYSCPDAPGWNMAIPDVVRAEAFLRELHAFEAQGTFPRLTLLYLPNDHTTGTTPGSPTPRAYLADNDLALGRVVEGLSHSRFWPTTCVFVVEDDSQDGVDHVDGHRSPALVISPYTRRGAVVHHFYNQTGVLHTMERILGLPAMNQKDGASSLMNACFQSHPDLRAYTCLPNRIPLGELVPKLSVLHGSRRKAARRSLALRFDKPDAADDDDLNRILWQDVKGSAPYPVLLAGARRGSLTSETR